MAKDISQAVREVCLWFPEAAEAKDVEAYFDAGGALYESCVACHSKYVIAPAESG